MTDIWQYLKSASKPIVLYGMGNGAEKIIKKLSRMNVKVSGVFASDGFVRDKTFMGFNITDYMTAKKNYGDMIVLLAFGTHIPEVMDNIYRIASHTELYAPELPVTGEGTFDIEYFKNNKDRIYSVRELMSDTTSASVFDSILSFKLSGDINLLRECETPSSEAYQNIIRPGKSGVFVDLGAYRGDTVTEYISYSGGYSRIYAVEPDPKTFKKLVQNVPPDVTCLNLAISGKKGSVLLSNDSGRGSHIAKNGICTLTDTVDNILNGQMADYIKFDVEGAESEAIDGARQTILNCKPILCVSAYHRAYDLIDIAEQVMSIRDDYKVYLRHFPCIPAWDTNYYFV